MLGREIENTFKEAKQITMQMRHPTKKNLKPRKIYHLQPDFPILHMTLASIKPDIKYKRKSSDNKCVITRRVGIGQMELLDLYEQCVEPDPEEKLREEQQDPEDRVMQRKLDFLKRNACNFENTQTG